MAKSVYSELVSLAWASARSDVLNFSFFAHIHYHTRACERGGGISTFPSVPYLPLHFTRGRVPPIASLKATTPRRKAVTSTPAYRLPFSPDETFNTHRGPSISLTYTIKKHWITTRPAV